MMMRAQVSLDFKDADLFDNFVVPYKEGRVLNSLIIKCLSAYYYNESIRAQIEGTHEIPEDDTRSEESLCDSIRNSLLMQDFTADELQKTINAGTEELEKILDKADEFSEKSRAGNNGFDPLFQMIANSKESARVDTNSIKEESVLQSPLDNDLTNLYEDLNSDIDTVQQYMEGIKQSFSTCQSGVVKLLRCIETLEARKSELEDICKRLEAESKVSHHSPFAKAQLVAADSLNNLKKCADNLSEEVNKVFDSAISMESDVL